MSCQNDVNIIFLKDRHKAVTQVRDFRLVGVFCGTVDILMQSDNSPLAVRVCRNGLLNKLLVLRHVCILSIQDNK